MNGDAFFLTFVIVKYMEELKKLAHPIFIHLCIIYHEYAPRDCKCSSYRTFSLFSNVPQDIKTPK